MEIVFEVRKKMDMLYCIVLFIVYCFAKATGTSDQKYFEISGGCKVVNVLYRLEDVSLSECAAKCTSYARDGSCKMAGYDMSSQTCQLAADNAIVTDSDSSSFVITMLNMCGSPSTPIYGFAVVSNGRTLCTFSCSPGYALVGVTSLQCVQGTWNGLPPTCEDIDECICSPCINGATCNNLVNRYTCECLPGYTGINCETEIDECTSSPCKNGATCDDLINGYLCICSAGFTGQSCGQDIDECLSTPCLNGGTCIDSINGYTCRCAAGFTGTLCSQDVNECTNSPCQNGGACTNGFGFYTCTCNAGFTGTDCDQDVNECNNLPCQNGGSCTNGFGFYTCTCATGFEGPDCDQDVNECNNSPCQNGGSCTNSLGFYTCTCAAGFKGTDCEQDINECMSSPCLNGGTCVDKVNRYICSCLSVHTGTHCEQDCYPGTPWEYNGTKDRTQTGTLCQRWDSQSPHPHPHTDLQYFPDATLAGAKNYCRNPERGEYSPWCMTSDPGKEWDYCDVIKC